MTPESTGDDLAVALAGATFSDHLRACFMAAATSCPWPKEEFDALCRFMALGPTAAQVVARFVESRATLAADLKSYLAGWCVGLAQVHTPPGVERQAVYEARHQRLRMDERGRRYLMQAIDAGLVADNAEALRWFGVGWCHAVRHQDDCVAGEQGHVQGTAGGRSA